MMQSFKNWFIALSLREQILIGILGVLLALTIAFYGIYTPIYDAATDARIRNNDVTMQAGRIAAKIDALRNPAAKSRPKVSAALNIFIAGEAGERGFTLERNQPRGDDRTEISIASARSTAFLGWIADLESRGIIIEDLNTRRMDNGTISITAILAKAGS